MIVRGNICWLRNIFKTTSIGSDGKAVSVFYIGIIIVHHNNYNIVENKYKVNRVKKLGQYEGRKEKRK